MIYLYNEFERPLSLFYKKLSMNLLKKPVNYEGHDLVVSLSNISPFFKNDSKRILELNSKLASAVKTEEPVMLAKMPCDVLYDHKKCSPIIIEDRLKAKNKLVLVVCINLKGLEFLGFYRPNVCILDYIVNDFEMSLLVAMGETSQPFVITFFDKNSKKIKKYKFYNEWGKCKFELENSEVRSLKKLGSNTPIFVPIFRPTKITDYVIACKEFDKRILKKDYSIK